MAKYYVRSGRVRQVISRSSRERAAYDVVLSAAKSGDGRLMNMLHLQRLGLVTSVSELGFTDSRKANFYPTHAIIDQIGPFRAFKRGREESEE